MEREGHWRGLMSQSDTVTPRPAGVMSSVRSAGLLRAETVWSRLEVHALELSFQTEPGTIVGECGQLSAIFGALHREATQITGVEPQAQHGLVVDIVQDVVALIEPAIRAGRQQGVIHTLDDPFDMIVADAARPVGGLIGTPARGSVLQASGF